jgi:hypothetical protein
VQSRTCRTSGVITWDEQGSFIRTLLPTTTAVLSLAWGSNLLPPKAFAMVIVVAVLAFWISLVAHFQDVEGTSAKDN